MSLDFFPFALRANYPHMKPADVAIWEAYIRAHPDAYEQAQYDVEVGSGPEFDTVVNAETGGSAEKLYKRKIDVVAHGADGIDIIEVKPNAGPSALGQVQAYRRLYVRDFMTARQVHAVVLTDIIGRDMRELAAADDVVLLTP